MPKIQRKLMATLAGLVALTLLATSWIAERGLRARETAQIQASLLQRAELVREILAPEFASPGGLQDRVGAAAKAAGARVTLISAEGEVRADSSVRFEDLPSLGNHGDRPEIQGGPQRRSRRLLTAQRDRRCAPPLPRDPARRGRR